MNWIGGELVKKLFEKLVERLVEILLMGWGYAGGVAIVGVLTTVIMKGD